MTGAPGDFSARACPRQASGSPPVAVEAPWPRFRPLGCCSWAAAWVGFQCLYVPVSLIWGALCLPRAHPEGPGHV